VGTHLQPTLRVAEAPLACSSTTREAAMKNESELEKANTETATVNEALALEVVEWIERCAHESQFDVVRERVAKTPTSTTDSAAIALSDGIVEIIFEMSMARIKSHVKLNDDEIMLLKDYLAAIPGNDIRIEVYNPVEGEEVVRMTRFHHVPRDKRIHIERIMEEISKITAQRVVTKEQTRQLHTQHEILRKVIAELGG
jgi:hypothetical protein